MEQGTFEEFHDDKLEMVPNKPQNVEVITIGDDSSSEEQAYVFQRRGPAFGNFQGDDSRSDDSNSYIKEENKLAFSPIAESPMVEKDHYEETPAIDMDLVEKILNKQLETLASVAQQCSNIEKAMIICTDPLKRTSAKMVSRTFLKQQIILTIIRQQLSLGQPLCLMFFSYWLSN